MLSPTNRLPKENISNVMRFGARVIGEECILRYKKTDGAPRFAIIVSTKVDKRATVRNRIRRIVSESLRQMLPPIDGVFVIRKNIARLSQKEARRALDRLLHEIVRS